MELPINPDPQDLNKSFLSGKKWWQWLCIIISFVVTIVFTLIIGNKLDPTLNGIIIGIIVVPFGYVGIFQKNGMDYFEYNREKRRIQRGLNTFYYVSNDKYKD